MRILRIISRFRTVAYSGVILQKLINEEGVIVKVIPDDALIAIGNVAGEIIAD